MSDHSPLIDFLHEDKPFEKDTWHKWIPVVDADGHPDIEEVEVWDRDLQAVVTKWLQAYIPLEGTFVKTFKYTTKKDGPKMGYVLDTESGTTILGTANFSTRTSFTSSSLTRRRLRRSN